MKFTLQRVHFMPKELEPGILYVSEEFGAVAHLCACGCGSKIRTPLGPTEWKLTETKDGPTLYPSVGNWQQKCQSHYLITKGEIRWAAKWSGEEILAGRQREQRHREKYYAELDRQRKQKRSLWQRIKDFLGWFTLKK